MRIRTGHGPNDWTKPEPVKRYEPVLPEAGFVAERLSWRDEYQQRWEKQRKAKAA